MSLVSIFRSFWPVDARTIARAPVLLATSLGLPILLLVLVPGGGSALAEGKSPPVFLPLVVNNLAWPTLGLGPGVTGFQAPVLLIHAGDGSNRLYVVEQGGRIQLVEDGQIRPAPLLDITDRVTCCGERGLLGLAFPPGAGPKDHFYVNYTATEEGQLVTRVSRFAMDSDSQVADPKSEQVILTFPQPYSNHNGGHLAFGPDGYLYIATGDGGSGGDPQNHAQNLGSLLGKLLRVHVEEGSVLTYTTPITNPFVGQANARPEIWAYGLRNPWRFSFDRETGDLYLGDVGQNAWEEIDYQPAGSPGGENYGWPILEGTHCYRADPCDPTGTVLPIWEYSQENGDRSVIGGYVYRGQAIPEMQGVYLFGDWVSGRIWGLRRAGDAWAHSLLLETGRNVASFGEDAQGELWIVDYAGGVYPLVTSQ